MLVDNLVITAEVIHFSLRRTVDMGIVLWIRRDVFLGVPLLETQTAEIDS